jgi:ribosomal protein S18 acetylase RimI-like enzyme
MAELRPYRDIPDRTEVIALWDEVFAYSAHHNAPPLVIDQKVQANDGLFFVSRDGDRLVGTIMCGYDGHRGWLYSLAVHPSARRRGFGTQLVHHAEAALAARGCVKVNLQVLDTNAAVAAFYLRLGYSIEPRISMGRRLAGADKEPDRARLRPGPAVDASKP